MRLVTDFGLALVAMMVLVTTFALGDLNGERRLKESAVYVDKAEWITDAHGKKVFLWKTNPAPAPITQPCRCAERTVTNNLNINQGVLTNNGQGVLMWRTNPPEVIP